MVLYVIVAICSVQLPWRTRKENILWAEKNLPLTEVPEEMREVHLL